MRTKICRIHNEVSIMVLYIVKQWRTNLMLLHEVELLKLQNLLSRHISIDTSEGFGSEYLMQVAAD